MPALKIVSTAPQLLNTKTVKNNKNKKGDNFIVECLMYFKNSTIIPVYSFVVRGKKDPIIADGMQNEIDLLN